jgi:hypothetical protein
LRLRFAGNTLSQTLELGYRADNTDLISSTWDVAKQKISASSVRHIAS